MNTDIENLFLCLQSRHSYIPVFERLRLKNKESPWRGERAPLVKDLSLNWILNSEEFVTDFLIKTVRNREIISGRANIQKIFLDKERVLCSQAWPASILQAAFARLVQAYLEPKLSPSLYSFRPGYSSHRAAQSLGVYLKTALTEFPAIYVARRDVSQFDANINKQTLIKMFEDLLGEQDDYVWQLLRSFLYVRSEDEKSLDYSAEIGIPMGFHITPISENLYLGELDRELTKESGGFYIRYGDDIVVAHPNFDILSQQLERAEDILSRLELAFKDTKAQDCVFTPDSRRGVEYLGVRVYANGTIFLSEKKEELVKKQVRACVRLTYQFNRGQSPQKILQAIINSLNLLIRFQSPYIDFVCQSATNEERIRHLDIWIAKQSLRPIFRTAHDRVFRYVSLRELRKIGLLSLIHLRNKRFRE